MDVERIFCAEQIVVPPELPDILKEYTKAVVVNNPDDIIAFSTRFGSFFNLLFLNLPSYFKELAEREAR